MHVRTYDTLICILALNGEVVTGGGSGDGFGANRCVHSYIGNLSHTDAVALSLHSLAQPLPDLRGTLLDVCTCGNACRCVCIYV